MSKEFIIRKNENGSWQNLKAWKNHLASLAPGSYKVNIVSTARRTHQQNAWLHAILPEIVQGLREAGYNDVKTPEDAKDVVKAIFFKKKITNGSETIEVIEGTSAQSKLNFAEKADEIIRWAAEYLGLDIAPPDKQLQCI